MVVERIGDHAEDASRVVDLLLRPVAATADDVGRQPRALQLLLVRGDVREGAQQHDHVARGDPVLVSATAAAAARNRASATRSGGEG